MGARTTRRQPIRSISGVETTLMRDERVVLYFGGLVIIAGIVLSLAAGAPQALYILLPVAAVGAIAFWIMASHRRAWRTWDRLERHGVVTMAVVIGHEHPVKQGEGALDAVYRYDAWGESHVGRVAARTSGPNDDPVYSPAIGERFEIAFDPDAPGVSGVLR